MLAFDAKGRIAVFFPRVSVVLHLADDMQMQQMHVVELPLRIVGSLGGFQVKSSQTSPAGKLCGKSMHQQLKPQMTAEKLRTDAHL